MSIANAAHCSMMGGKVPKFPPVYKGSPVVNMCGFYGTTPTSWTSLDDRYVFQKFSSSQLDLNWSGGRCIFNGGNMGMVANVLPADAIYTEMTIEVVMSQFTTTSQDNGIVFALDSGAPINNNMYSRCKGMRNAGTDGLIASYSGAAQDRPTGLIQSFPELKTIAFTNGSSVGKRILFYVNGVAVPSQLNSSAYTSQKVPSKFGIGGTGTTATGWQSGLKANIHAVRFHYGIIEQADLAANYQIDAELYS